MDKCCWKCDQTFEKADGKKVHMASHGCLQVLCVWCHDTKKVLRRAVDLLSHVKDRHRDVLALHRKNKILNEKNCLILAINPEDYRRATGAPPANDVKYLKDSVRKWCRNEEEVAKFERGWADYGGLPTPDWEPDLDYDLESPPHCEVDAVEEDTCTELQATSDPVETGYSPSKPDIEEIVAINVGSDEASAIIYGPVENNMNSSYRKFILDRSVLHTAKVRESLMRRMASLNSNTTHLLPSSWETSSFDMNRGRVAAKLGVEEHLVISSMSPSTTKRKVSLDEYREANPPKQPKQSQKYEFTAPSSPTHGLPLIVKRSSKERALKLLSSGSMPLMTPARRKWNTDSTVALPLPGAFQAWPPAKWKALTPDAKLLLWQTTATQLALLCGMDVNRELIMDNFNFLALPGTKENKFTKPTSITRFHNFRLIRRIAKGTDHSQDAIEMLKQLEDSTNASTTHPVIKLLFAEMEKHQLEIYI